MKFTAVAIVEKPETKTAAAAASTLPLREAVDSGV